ncbi:MAG: hypothetical protein VKL39_12815 [Leptolyngbyaceae bacterium]|nr:hypothetical protein [Leptolyngbyaceae bacterium]
MAIAHEQELTSRVRFKQQNLMSAELSPATVVTLYLLPTRICVSGKSFKRNLRQGAASFFTPSMWEIGNRRVRHKWSM